MGQSKARRKLHIKSLLSMVLGKGTIVGALVVVQILVLAFSVSLLADSYTWVYAFFVTLSVCILIWLNNKPENPSYKLPWAVIIAALPVFGGLFYLLFGNKGLPKRLAARYRVLQEQERKELEQPPIEVRVEAVPENCKNLARYITWGTGAPVWSGTNSRYLPLGEDMWRNLLLDLEKAQRFIFMEYFILEEGEMLAPVLEILQKKAAAGVEVRLMYDDAGSMQTLPLSFARNVRCTGIQCAVFNPIGPHMNSLFNYRDHRKICVIDGNIGYCGGINLADEYINAYPKHGHWKDTAVRLEGNAVWTLTVLFTTLWRFTTEHEEAKPEDCQKYAPSRRYAGQGFVQPFGDSPLDRINVSEEAYMHIINRAKRYVYITTPYLIIDHEMLTALQLAARSGVDVRILTPAHGDKWFVHQTTRSFYSLLLESGVHIYEYTPGFVHAKMYVSDDETAIVGTANMDFRSFYLHFECGVAFYGGDIIKDVKRDILSLFAKSRKLPEDYGRTVSAPVRLVRALLRLVAPLM